MNDNNQPGNGARLKALLKDAGYKSTRLDAVRRLVMFRGRTRDWTFYVNIYNGWLHIHTFVCEVPELPGLRAELLDVAMTANHDMSLTKFTKSPTGLNLELEYRDEHVDAQVLGNLVSLIVANAEEQYPRIFRVVSGDAVLESLDPSTALSTAA